MKQELYSFFFHKTKNRFVSRACCTILYKIFILRYLLKKLITKKEIVESTNPREIISNVYSKPDYKINISEKCENDKIDASIIMPVYNYKDLIDESICSVLNQETQYKFELIIVDDGSTDGAYDVIEKYRDDERVVIIHQENKGIGGARNTGLDMASGKYIMFMDCDDYMHNNYVQKLLDEAYKSDDDIVISSYSLVKKNNGKIISRRDIVYSKTNLMKYSDEETIMNYQGLPWNKAYKRELFDKVRYIEGFWYEDTITHFLVFPQCKKFSYIEESLYDYIWYEDNFSHIQNNVSPKSLERYWILEVMAEERERIGLKNNEGFYKILLRHLGRPLYSGIYKFENSIRNAAFVLGCELLEKYKPASKIKLTFKERQLEKALINRNIRYWMLVCNNL